MTTFTASLTTRRALVADLDMTSPAKAPMRHGLVQPADLRSVVSRDEIREADAKHNARMETQYRDACMAAWTVFADGGLTRGEFTAKLEALKVERNRRQV